MRLRPPDEDTKRALARFRADADGKRILEWLGSSLEDLDRSNRGVMDGVALRQSQGASQALAEFIDLLQGITSKASAREVLNTSSRGSA